MRDYAATGTLPQGRGPAQYGVQEADFQEAQFALAAAQSSFEGLAPAVRAKYGDLYEVLRAMEDPTRAAELASDGILIDSEGTGPLATEKPSRDAPAPSHPANTPKGEGEALSEASLELPLDDAKKSA